MRQNTRIVGEQESIQGRLNPLSVVLGPLRTVRQWLVPLLIAALFGGRGDNGFPFFLLVVALGVVGVVFQAVVVMRTQWSIDDAGMTLRTGLLNLETRSVPFERMQNVDVVEPLMPRILGLAELKVETAGAAGADLKLSYLSRSTAVQLRNQLSRRSAAAGNIGAGVAGDTELSAADFGRGPGTGNVLIETSPRELFVAGATANRAGALAVAAGVAFQYADDFGLDIDGFIQEAVGSAADETGARIVIGVVAVVVIAGVVGWLVSVVEAIVRFHGFRLERRGGDLYREFGLLDHTSATFPLARVQSVKVERAFLRRAIGYAAVWADTAGSATGEFSGGVISPIMRNAAVADLVAEVLPRSDLDPNKLRPVSRVAVRRAFVPDAIVVVIAAGVVVVFRPWIAAILLVVGLALAGWHAVRHFAALGYRLDEQYLHARSGVLNERQWVVPRAKIQSVSVTSSFFQRRLGVATMRAHTAGTGSPVVTVIDLERNDARTLADDLSMTSASTAFSSDGV